MEIMGRVSENAYAKINLHLDVTGILDNGFHSVATVMQTVSVFDEIILDEIKITEGEPRFTVFCNTDGVPCDERNLVWKAARLFCDRVGLSLTAKIIIDKKIPMAAGMAGGSADCAATLRAFNRALGFPFAENELIEMGAELGSDVPFCIVCGTRYACGRGELLSEFPGMPDCYIVAACEGEGVSTPWAYRLLDEAYGDFVASAYTPVSTEPLREAMAEGSAKRVAEVMYNIFEAPVLERRPVAREIKELLLGAGARGAMMSGSGPSVFGIFEEKSSAESAVRALEEKGYTGYLCKPCGNKQD